MRYFKCKGCRRIIDYEDMDLEIDTCKNCKEHFEPSTLSEYLGYEKKSTEEKKEQLSQNKRSDSKISQNENPTAKVIFGFIFLLIIGAGLILFNEYLEGYIMYIIVGIVSLVVLFLISGIRIIRPIEKGLVETFGKYSKTAEPGLSWIFPIFQTMRKVNITEQMVDVPEQIVQTSDKLNTKVDAVVYYQVADVMKAEYNVDNHQRQLTSLARTTLRAVMGKLTLTQCIQERNKINEQVEAVLDKETDSYGVKVLRVEVQRIEPPEDVQTSMNEVVKAEQLKIAAKDKATALETEADGIKRKEIKEAEGKKQSSILKAEGKAEAFKLIESSFKSRAELLKRLEVTENSLKNNAKIILTKDGINPQLIIGDLPISKEKKK